MTTSVVFVCAAYVLGLAMGLGVGLTVFGRYVGRQRVKMKLLVTAADLALRRGGNSSSIEIPGQGLAPSGDLGKRPQFVADPADGETSHPASRSHRAARVHNDIPSRLGSLPKSRAHWGSPT